MPWPQATDYNAAVQNPHLCFTDADLRQGQAAGDPFGLPLPHAGNFADVYQFNCPGDKRWAVKCFTREVHGLRDRYQAVSAYLREHPRRFLVGFTYLEEGVRVRNAWWPVLKMDWIEGFSLNEFAAQQVDRPGVLERLAHLWLRLARELREAEVAHGDLQHGNVLLVPGDKGNVALRLIDYDGLWVPALANQPSGESGHPNYQHPQRLREGSYGREVDRFSHLVIYTALRCLAVGGRALWQKYENAENLLFREADFRTPHTSRLFRDLWDLGSESRQLLGQLVLACTGPLAAVPQLDELLEEGRVRPLTRSEEEQVKDLLRLTVVPRRALGTPPAPQEKIPPHLPSPLVAVDLEPTIVRRAESPGSPVGQPAALGEWAAGPPQDFSGQQTLGHSASPPVLVATPRAEAMPAPVVPSFVPVVVPKEEPPGRRIVVPLTPLPESDPVLTLAPLAEPEPGRPPRTSSPQTPPVQEIPPVPKVEVLLLEGSPSRPALPPAPKRVRPLPPVPPAQAEDPLAATWTWLAARPLLVMPLVGGFLLLAFLVFLALLVAVLKGH
jgi:hypothetical protein